MSVDRELPLIAGRSVHHAPNLPSVEAQALISRAPLNAKRSGGGLAGSGAIACLLGFLAVRLADAAAAEDQPAASESADESDESTAKNEADGSDAANEAAGLDDQENTTAPDDLPTPAQSSDDSESKEG